MKICMSGIDFKSCPIEEREKVSFNEDQIKELCVKVSKTDGILGCVILSTCNRTEIYLNCRKNFNKNPWQILLSFAKINNFYGKAQYLDEKAAVYHIIETACGLNSQIVGEEQICSQINKSAEISRNAHVCGNALSVLFQNAVTAGKKVLAGEKISQTPLSGAYGAAVYLKRHFGSLAGRRGLVIGNGKIGRLLCRLLTEAGANVNVTIRSYKRGAGTVAKGCIPIAYGERYECMENRDFVVSCTKSPHFTIEKSRLETVLNKPEIFIDLAVPRDIEKGVGELAKCININSLGINTNLNEDVLDRVYSIIEKYSQKFWQWFNYSCSINDIKEIKEIISERLYKSGKTKSTNEIISETTDIILGSFKEVITPELMEECKIKIKSRAR